MDTFLDRFRANHADKHRLFLAAAADQCAGTGEQITQFIAHHADAFNRRAGNRNVEYSNTLNATDITAQLLQLAISQTAVEHRNLTGTVFQFCGHLFQLMRQLSGRRFDHGSSSSQRVLETFCHRQEIETGNRFNSSDTSCNRSLRYDLEQTNFTGIANMGTAAQFHRIIADPNNADSAAVFF